MSFEMKLPPSASAVASFATRYFERWAAKQNAEQRRNSAIAEKNSTQSNSLQGSDCSDIEPNLRAAAGDDIVFDLSPSTVLWQAPPPTTALRSTAAFIVRFHTPMVVMTWGTHTITQAELRGTAEWVVGPPSDGGGVKRLPPMTVSDDGDDGLADDTPGGDMVDPSQPPKGAWRWRMTQSSIAHERHPEEAHPGDALRFVSQATSAELQAWRVRVLAALPLSQYLSFRLPPPMDGGDGAACGGVVPYDDADEECDHMAMKQIPRSSSEASSRQEAVFDVRIDSSATAGWGTVDLSTDPPTWSQLRHKHKGRSGAGLHREAAWERLL